MDYETICNDLEIVSCFSILIPLVLLLWLRKQINPKHLSLVLLVVIGFITEVLNFLCRINGTNNDLIVRVYTFFEVLLIALFYSTFFNSKWSLLVLPVFLVIAFIDYNINGIENFDNYATAFEAISFSTISLWAFYYFIKNMLFKNLITESFFWFNSAILIYFGGCLAVFVFDNYLLYQTSYHNATWAIHSVLNIIYNIVLAIGFWKTRHQ